MSFGTWRFKSSRAHHENEFGLLIGLFFVIELIGLELRFRYASIGENLQS